MIRTQQFTLETEGGFSVVNVTERVRNIVKASGIQEGMALVFYRHTTGAVILDEHEAGVLADLERVLDDISPVERDYRHHLRAVDFNAHAHMRTALLGAQVVIPITKGDLLLGRYQDIMVIDMQTERAPRHVAVTVMGDQEQP
jgi:secondary thiamine-phosphate synthase enzyme